MDERDLIKMRQDVLWTVLVQLFLPCVLGVCVYININVDVMACLCPPPLC